jgi:hypothetical protein
LVGFFFLAATLVDDVGALELDDGATVAVPASVFNFFDICAEMSYAKTSAGEQHRPVS